MTPDRKITLLGIRPVHRRGEPSHIEASVVLEYLRSAPVFQIILTEDQTIRLIEQAAMALRAVRSA